MSKINIYGAIYGELGEPTRACDVTVKVQGLVDDSEDGTIVVSNDTLGNPGTGETKAFGAMYQVGNKMYAVAAREGERVTFRSN